MNLDAYKRNYDRIAADHIEHWRETGKNPFQDPALLAENETTTFGMVTRYVPAGTRILDAGCGMGDLLLRLDGYERYGIDIAASYVKIARERELQVKRGRIEKLPFPPGAFHGVIAADILEHVIDLHAAAKELLRVLRPGGHLIVRVPNMEPPGCGPIAGYEYVHLRILDEGTLCTLFNRIFGCEVVESIATTKGNPVIHMVVRK